jgi:hypothetical protein
LRAGGRIDHREAINRGRALSQSHRAIIRDAATMKNELRAEAIELRRARSQGGLRFDLAWIEPGFRSLRARPTSNFKKRRGRRAGWTSIDTPVTCA